MGGRSTTVNAYDDSSYPVELGASIFVKVNSILNDAVGEFNLSTSSFTPDTKIPGAALAVWDGQKFVVNQETNGWWDTAKLLWKYGLAPIKTMRLMRKVVGQFLKMYDHPLFPFEDLTQVAQDAGLLAVTAATGLQYLKENSITGDFGHDIVQASTRVNYAINLDHIHGLEAMVCMAAEEARSVQGGNWQIFDRMVKASKATTVLGTKVSAITPQGKTKQYSLKFDATNHSTLVTYRSDRYDEIIVATPFQVSDLSLPLDDIAIDEIPYVQLHVTLFASPHLLSPTYFNLAPDEAVPRVILTTLPKDDKPHKGPAGVGSPGFFSISLLHGVTNPHTNSQEYLYKIFSAEPPNSTFLAHLLDIKFEGPIEDAETSDKDITWMYRKLWNSYPYEYPRVTFEKIKLAEGLWYTGGMDSFISTMETNALMGRNVAQLVIDKWVREEVLSHKIVFPQHN